MTEYWEQKVEGIVLEIQPIERHGGRVPQVFNLPGESLLWLEAGAGEGGREGGRDL